MCVKKRKKKVSRLEWGSSQRFHRLHHCSLGLGEKSFTQRLCWLFGGCPWRLWRRVRRELPLRLQSSGRCKHVEGTWKESCAEMAEMHWVLLVPNTQVKKFWFALICWICWDYLDSKASPQILVNTAWVLWWARSSIQGIEESQSS